MHHDAEGFYKIISGYADPMSPDGETYPNIKLFLEMDSLRQRINVHAFSRENNEILSIIKDDMPKGVYYSFKQLSLQFQANRIPEGKFLEIIKKLSSDSKYDIDNKQYPNFNLYLDYTKLSSSIDLKQLINELSAYGLEVCEEVSGSKNLVKNYKALCAISKLKGILLCTLAPDEAEKLIELNAKNYSELWNDCLEVCSSEQASFMNENLPSLIKLTCEHYKLAFQRDSVMSAKVIDRASQSQAVCIAGGFHTQGMKTELEKQGFTVVTVSPSSNGNSSDNKSYLNNMLNRLDDLETRFKRKTETLRQPALTKRNEQNLALQFNLLMDSVRKLNLKQDILKYLSRITVEAKIRHTDTEELLDDAVLYVEKDTIYASFPSFGLTLKITAEKDKAPVLTTLNPNATLPADAKEVDLSNAQIALGFKSPMDMIESAKFEDFALNLFSSVMFYDASDYVSFLYTLKRLQTHRNLPDDTIRLLIYEAVLDYVGFEKPDEFTSEIISERISEAEGYLKHIFKNTSHRKNFVRSFINYSKINIYYNNYLTPLFIGAFNIAHDKPVNSTTLLKLDHDLFNEAATLGHNPWFSRARLYIQSPEQAAPYSLEPVQGKTTEDGKKQLRILVLGAHENGGESSPSKILKSYMDQLPEGMWDEVIIESVSSSFPATVYPLDSATGKPSDPVNIFPFDENGEYKDEQTGIIYRQIDPADTAHNPLHPDFEPKSEYDIVISSDFGLEGFTSSEQMDKTTSNLTGFLADKGVLVLGMGELGFGRFIQRDGETTNTLSPMIPFFNLPTTNLKFQALNSRVSFVNPADNVVIKTAIDLHRKFQTQDNPTFDIQIYVQFLAVFGENPATLAAFILQGVPENEISKALPVLANRIFDIQAQFSEVSEQERWQNLFPHIINLLPTNPDNWVLKEGNENTVEDFQRKTKTEITTLYDNRVYRFEIGYYKQNAIVFVSKSVRGFESTKTFIVSHIAEDSPNAVYQSHLDTVSRLLSIAEHENLGQVPSFSPNLVELEPDAANTYDGYWNPDWVRPSPKYLHIAQNFIDKVESLSKKNLILFKGKVYSPEIADMFINHPLVVNNSKEGALIFLSIYYLNPQLAGIIMRSMNIHSVPIFKILIPNLLNEQFAKMLSFEMQAEKLSDTKNLPVNRTVLLKYLEPAFEFSDEYRKNIGEILQHLDAKTLTTIYSQLYEYIQSDFQDAWAATVLGSIFHTAPISVVKQQEVFAKLPRPAANWLKSREQQPETTFNSIEELNWLINRFLLLNDKIFAFDKTQPLDFDNPSDELKSVIDIYGTLIKRDLTNKDYEVIEQVIADQVTIGSKKYDRTINQLFMELFNGYTHFDQAGYALENILRKNPALAGLIIRSVEKGKHFQMGSIIFNMSEAGRNEIISNEITPLSEKTAKRFSDYDGFALYVMLNFHHIFQENQKENHDDIIDTINSLDDDKIRDLITHGYFYYLYRPNYTSFIKDFTKFFIEQVGDEKIAQLFADNTPINNDIKRWINREILEIEGIQEADLAAMLEQHPSYEKVKKLTVKIGKLDTHIRELEHYIEQGTENLSGPLTARFDSVIFNLNKADEAFRNGYIYRGINFYGKAIDNLEILIASNKDFSENIDLRLSMYYAHKVDSALAQYIATDKLTRIKSILPHNRNKVVGKLRIIPNDENGFKLLFDEKYLNEGFAVVSEYPQNIADMAKPRAIIAEHGIGRNEHAAERAADWEIPYLVIPRARKLLSALVQDGETELWVTIELGGRTALNVIRKSTVEEIEEEIAYRSNMDRSEGFKPVDIIPADLSVRDIQKLEDMGLDDNIYSGNKSSRLGHLKKLGYPVKEGFVLPFGFYDEFSKQNQLDTKIKDILAQPDFNERKAEYLEQIRDIILNIQFPENLEADILKWHKEHLKGKPAIARSSTNAEDLPGYAGAGVYESYPELYTGKELIEGIKKVYASVWSERAFDNRNSFGIEHLDVYPSVLVQEMSLAKFSGVMNTANEINGSRDEITLSVSPGHGGAVDTLAAEFVFDRKNKTIIDDETDIPEFLLETVVEDLANHQFLILDNLGQGVESEFEFPQKIEFSYDEDGYWVNQTKDLASFRKERIENQEDVETDQDLTEHEVAILNHSGVYLDTARRITQIAAQSLSKVRIIKMSGISKAVLSSGKNPTADAKDVMALLNLDLKKGNRIKIVAIGPDSNKTVAELTQLVNHMLG